MKRLFGPPMTDVELEKEDQLTLFPPHVLDGFTMRAWCSLCGAWYNLRTGDGHFAACLRLNPHTD